MNDRFSPNSPPPSGVEPVTTARVGADDHQADARDIERFLGGDIRGFEAIVERYRRQAYTIALGLTGNHDDAMDALQKAFLRIHRALPRFRRELPFFPWMYRIVRNAALNQKRDEKRHRGQVPLEWVREPDGRPSPLEQTVAENLRHRLWICLEELPPEQREVFMLYHFQGLKYREIATALDIPLGTVMSRLHSARIELRHCLGEEALG